MKNLHLATLLLLTFTTVFVTACSKQSRLTRVTVAGESNIKAQPDTAVVVISVVTQGQQALNAQQENARKSDAVIHAVQGAAGANPWVKKSGHSVQPPKAYTENQPSKNI